MLYTLGFWGAILIALICSGLAGFFSKSRRTLRVLLCNVIALVVAVASGVLVEKVLHLNLGLVAAEGVRNAILAHTYIPMKLVNIVGLITLSKYYNSIVVVIVYVFVKSILGHLVNIKKWTIAPEKTGGRTLGVVFGVINGIISLAILSTVFVQLVSGIAF